MGILAQSGQEFRPQLNNTSNPELPGVFTRIHSNKKSDHSYRYADREKAL
jgi:hypothetical protein